jgi:uncharacterized protein (TIGR02246 family)
MKQFLKNTVFFAAVIGIAACQSQNKQQVKQATLDTATILASLDSLGATVGRADNTADADLYASTWAEDGIMSAPGNPPIQGRDAIVSAFKSRPKLPPGATLRINPIELKVLSAEWAYAFGVDTLTFVPNGETEPIKETSTFLVLIHKTSQGWQTYREVLSSNQPLTTSKR